MTKADVEKIAKAAGEIARQACGEIRIAGPIAAAIVLAALRDRDMNSFIKEILDKK